MVVSNGMVAEYGCVESHMTDLEILCQELYTRVCPLYRLDDRDRPYLVGTGIPFFTSHGSYLLTASHVLDDLDKSHVISAGSQTLVRFHKSSIVLEHVDNKFADVDIGAIRLASNVSQELEGRFQFVSPAECGGVVHHNKLSLYVIIGYPHTRNKPRPLSMSEHRATPTYVILREFSDTDNLYTAHLHPSVHFALEAPLKSAMDFTGKNRLLPKLQGMSGGGVWRVGLNKKTGAIDSAVLVGIGIEHHKKHAAVVVTRIEWALRLLEFDKPDGREGAYGGVSS